MSRTRVVLLLGTCLGVAAAVSSTAGAVTSALASASPGRHALPAWREGHDGPLPTEARPVVLIGVSGLLWSDVSPAATPALWRLAGAGSVGNLVVHAVSTVTCPADGWATLNSGVRASAPHPDSGGCPPLPAVVPRGAPAGGTPAGATIPGMAPLIAGNRQYHYNPDWGLLATAAGSGNCALAIGPGAALALANSAGTVPSYLPSLAAANRQTLSRCPLTAVDLGAVPAPAAPGGTAARAATARADDRAIARLDAELPAGATLIVAALADDSAPHLRPIIIDGPGYANGLLGTVSTRQPGLAFLTDVTPTVLQVRGRPESSRAVGKPLEASGRGGLAVQIRDLTGQDTAAQVYRTTFGWFFAIFSVGEAVVFGLIALLLWGSGEDRRRRRRAAARTAGVIAGSIPAGTFLASLVPWWMSSHPAVLLYGLTAAWAAVVAAIALAGPWRRDPMGPVGMIGAITLLVIGLDVMTGSRLQLNTPFGLNVLWGGRLYGEDNNTVGLYAASAVLCAAWLGGTTLRPTAWGRPGEPGWRGARGRAVLAVSGVALFAVVASGWPGFGAKVGGTIAMVPGLVLLIMAVAGVRITPRRVALALVSGAAVIAAFALVSYLTPVAGHSDVGAFAGQALHGGGGGTFQRKISTNLSSLTGTPYNLIIPLALIGLGVLLLRPTWFGAGSLVQARRRVPLLGITLAVIWLMGLLGWFAEDSGVAVPGAMFPFVLPLAIAIVSGVPLHEDSHRTGIRRFTPAVASPRTDTQARP